MIILRVVPAVLAAAALAGWFTYFVTSPAQVAPGQRLSPTLPDLPGPDARASTSIDQPPIGAEEKAAQAYREAAEAILRRAPNARAAASADEQPITEPIPLPKRRPVIAP